MSLLTGVTNTILNLSQTFTYGTNQSGELARATSPLGAEIEWDYAGFTYATQSMTLREVSSRRLRTSPGTTQWTYTLGYDAGDGARQHHWYRTVTDGAANLVRVYMFQPDPASPYFGLVHEQNEHLADSWALKGQTAYTWAASASGQPYIAQVSEKLDPGTANEKIAIRYQEIDQYGNMTRHSIYDYAALGQHGAPFRDYQWMYVTDSAYTNAFLRNRLREEWVFEGSGPWRRLKMLTYDQYSGSNPCYAGGFALGLVDRSWVVEHDYAIGTGHTLRGNATRLDPMGAPAVCRKFDTLGNLVTQVNSTGQTLDVGWSSGSAYAVPTLITPNANSALQRSMVYNTLLDMTQVNSPNAVQQDFGYDTLHRPTTAEMETGATVSYTYSADGRVITATVNGKFTRTTTDGLGRTVKAEKGHGSTVVSIVESEYAPCACSPSGKLWRVSRPYAPGGTPVWTTYTWDVLGRTTRVDAPAGQFTTYEYVGNTVKVTDAAGKWKTYTLDAAGNLVKVLEPNPAGGTWETSYTYNGLNQLTEVRMTRGATTQVRTWVYDTNQKLVSETLPESGMRTFGYDSAGRLAWKKDAKNQKIAFEYDSYDRVTVVKRYPVDGGAEDAAQRVTMAYDGTTGNSKGRLKEAQYGFGWTEAYTYTNAGLPLTKSLTWPSTSGAGILTLTAEYDNEGRRTSLRYPTHYTSGTYTANNGRKLIYGFDSVGRLSTVNQETGGALISAINYNAAWQVTSWTRAWDTNPSASETFDFNAAGQLTRQKLLNPSTLVDVEYRYSASNNDGRLWQRKNWVSGEEVTYQYDQLGRLSTAATTSTAWGLSWAFDGFGNRLQQSVTKGSAPVHSVAVDGLTNRMVGQTYDANGNMQIPGLLYDVDNRLFWDGVFAYMYSTTNQRLKVYDAAGTNYAWFHGFEGEMLAVYKLEKQGGDANRTWPVLQADKERVYAMGRLLRMGTQDVVMDRGASVIRHGTQNLAYYPYGEEQGGASANDRASTGHTHAIHPPGSTTHGTECTRSSGGGLRVQIRLRAAELRPCPHRGTAMPTWETIPSSQSTQQV